MSDLRADDPEAGPPSREDPVPATPKPARRKFLEFLLTRRGVLISSLGTIVAVLFGVKVTEAVTRKTDPVTDKIIEGANKILGVDVLATRVTVGGAEFGLVPLPEWTVLEGSPSSFANWRNDGKEPPGFTTFLGEIFVELSGSQALFLKAVTAQVVSRTPATSMQAVALGGGGDGDPLHAYISVGDATRIVYTKDGGDAMVHIFEPLSTDHSKQTLVHVTVISSVSEILKTNVSFIFQKAESAETSSRLIGSVDVVGFPSDPTPELEWDGERAIKKMLDTAGFKQNFQYSSETWPST